MALKRHFKMCYSYSGAAIKRIEFSQNGMRKEQVEITRAEHGARKNSLNKKCSCRLKSLTSDHSTKCLQIIFRKVRIIGQ